MINNKIINNKFILIFNVVSIINIIKYKKITNKTIKKLISPILKNHEYSSSENKLSFIKILIKKTPKNSTFKNKSNLKTEQVLIFSQPHSLY